MATPREQLLRIGCLTCSRSVNAVWKRQRWVATLAGVLFLFSLSILGCQPQVSVGPGMQLLYVSSEGSLVLADIGDPPGAKVTLTELHHVGEGSVEASWSPDGERIVVRHQETSDRLDLWVYEVSSGEVTPLIQGFEAYGYGMVDWLSDGEHLVFDHGTYVARALEVISIGEAVSIAMLSYYGSYAMLSYYGSYAWSPAGDQITYCRERVVDPPTLYESGQSGDVAIYDISTSETVTLVEGTSEFFYTPLAWPASDRLLVWRHKAREWPSQFELFAYNPQEPGSTPRPLEAVPRHMDRDFIVGITPPDLSEPFESNGQYNWSPDLSHVAIAMHKPHASQLLDAEVWVLSDDGSQAFKVADDGQRGGRPVWRPGKEQLTSGNH